MRPGDFIAFPPGPNGAHKFRNDGDAPCMLLTLGQPLERDVAEFLDSEKIFTPVVGRYWIHRKKDAVSYWEGE